MEILKRIIKILVLSGVLCSSSVMGQVDSSFFEFRRDSLFIAKLIELANENYPLVNVNEQRVLQAEKSLKMAKLSWLRNLNFLYQFNQISDPQTGASVLTPSLGLGLSINVGSVIMVPLMTKKAKSELQIQKDNLKVAEIGFQNEVYVKYYDLLNFVDVYTVQTQATENMELSYEWVKRKFERGEILIEELNKAAGAYIVSKERQIGTEFNIKKSKKEIELLIGMKLEDVTTDENLEDEDSKSKNEKNPVEQK